MMDNFIQMTNSSYKIDFLFRNFKKLKDKHFEKWKRQKYKERKQMS